MGNLGVWPRAASIDDGRTGEPGLLTSTGLAVAGGQPPVPCRGLFGERTEAGLLLGPWEAAVCGRVPASTRGPEGPLRWVEMNRRSF